MQTTVGIITAIVNALLNDVNKGGKNFLEWCYAEFGKYPTMYIGYDNFKPPQYDPNNPNDSYPIIALFAVESTYGDKDVPFWATTLAFLVGNDSDPDVDSTGLMTVITQKGFLQVEAFRQEAEQAIMRAKIETAGKPTGQFADEESQFPVYKSYSTITHESLKDYLNSMPSSA